MAQPDPRVRPPLAVVVAANVRFERLAQALSQERLARLADVSRETIRRIEAGRLEEDGYSMTLQTLDAIADALGLEASSLLVWNKVATRAYLRGDPSPSHPVELVVLPGQGTGDSDGQLPLMTGI